MKTISAAKQGAAEEKSIPALEAQLAGIIGDASATPPVTGREDVAAAAK